MASFPYRLAHQTSHSTSTACNPFTLAMASKSQPVPQEKELSREAVPPGSLPPRGSQRQSPAEPAKKILIILNISIDLLIFRDQPPGVQMIFSFPNCCQDVRCCLSEAGINIKSNGFELPAPGTFIDLDWR